LTTFWNISKKSFVSVVNKMLSIDWVDELSPKIISKTPYKVSFLLDGIDRSNVGRIEFRLYDEKKKLVSSHGKDGDKPVVFSRFYFRDELDGKKKLIIEKLKVRPSSRKKIWTICAVILSKHQEVTRSRALPVQILSRRDQDNDLNQLKKRKLDESKATDTQPDENMNDSVTGPGEDGINIKSSPLSSPLPDSPHTRSIDRAWEIYLSLTDAEKEEFKKRQECNFVAQCFNGETFQN